MLYMCDDHVFGMCIYRKNNNNNNNPVEPGSRKDSVYTDHFRPTLEDKMVVSDILSAQERYVHI